LPATLASFSLSKIFFVCCQASITTRESGFSVFCLSQKLQCRPWGIRRVKVIPEIYPFVQKSSK